MRTWILLLALSGMMIAASGWTRVTNTRSAFLPAFAQAKVKCANPSCKKPNKATNNACENCGQALYENVNICKERNLKANGFCRNTEIKRLARSEKRAKCTTHKASAPNERIVRVKVCPLSHLEANDECPTYDVIEFPESKRPNTCDKHFASEATVLVDVCKESGKKATSFCVDTEPRRIPKSKADIDCDIDTHRVKVDPKNDPASRTPRLRWKVGDRIERTLTVSGEVELEQMVGTMTSIETITAANSQDYTVKSVTSGKMTVAGIEIDVPSSEQTQRLFLNGALAEVIGLESEFETSMFGFIVLPDRPFTDGLKWNYLLPKAISRGPYDLNHEFVAQTRETIDGQSCYRVTATFRENGGIGTGRGTFWISLNDFDAVRAECAFSNCTVSEGVIMNSLKISMTRKKR